jgi:hypothetical protein
MPNTGKRRQNRRIKTKGIAGELAQRHVTTNLNNKFVVIFSDAPA